MENVDFLPDRIKSQRYRRRHLLRQAYMLGACLAALIVLGYARQGTVSKAQAELSVLKDRGGNVRQQLATLNLLEQQQAELMIKKRINDQLGSRAKALDLLIEMESLMPASISLTNLALEGVEVRQPIQQASGTAAPPGGKIGEKVTNRLRLVINGVAPTDVDVANFIGQLAASSLFEDVNMGYVKNVEFRGLTAREFQASCYVAR